MRTGKVLAVFYYTDTSFRSRVPSVEVTVREEYKLFGMFPITRLRTLSKYGYFQRDIQVGDTVGFELDCFGTTALAKLTQ